MLSTLNASSSVSNNMFIVIPPGCSVFISSSIILDETCEKFLRMYLSCKRATSEQQEFLLWLYYLCHVSVVVGVHSSSGEERERPAHSGGAAENRQRQSGVRCCHGSQKHGPRCQEQGTHRYVRDAKVYLPQANIFSSTSAEELCVPLNYLRPFKIYFLCVCIHSASIAFLSEAGWHCLNLFNSLCILMGPRVSMATALVLDPAPARVGRRANLLRNVGQEERRRTVQMSRRRPGIPLPRVNYGKSCTNVLHHLAKSIMEQAKLQVLMGTFPSCDFNEWFSSAGYCGESRPPVGISISWSRLSVSELLCNDAGISEGLAFPRLQSEQPRGAAAASSAARLKSSECPQSNLSPSDQMSHVQIQYLHRIRCLYFISS